MIRALAGPVLLAFTLPAFGQVGWNVRHYDTQQGLPQNSVLALQVTDDGYLWVATEGGLVRFDGDQTRVYSRLTEPTSILGDRFLSLLRSEEGGLFVVAYPTHPYRISRNLISPLGFPTLGGGEGLLRGEVPSERFFERALDPAHPLEGRSEWQADDVHWRTQVLRLNTSEHGVLGPHSILIYRDTALVRRMPLEATVVDLFTTGDRLNGILADGSLVRVDLERHRLDRLPTAGLPVLPAQIQRERWDLFRSRSDVLLRIDRRIFLMVGSPGSDTLRAELLLDDVVSDRSFTDMVWIPEEGSLVIGTPNNGLYVYERCNMRHIIKDWPGRGPQGTYGQLQLPNGRIRLADGAEVDEDGNVSWNMSPPVFPSFSRVVEDKAGVVWYSSQWRVHGWDRSQGTLELDPGMGQVGDLWVEGDSIWVASHDGIGYIKDRRFHPVRRYTKEEAIPFAEFIRRGYDGRLWVATEYGTFKFDTRTRALEAIPELAGKYARSLQVVDGRMLVATYGDGAFVCDGERCLRFPFDPRRFLSHTHAFLPDSVGNIWIDTNQGLLCMKRKAVEVFLADTLHHIHYAYFGTREGIGGVEFNGGCDPPYLRLPNGTVSYPVLDGLVWFVPETIPDPYPSRPILFDHVLVDGHAVEDTASIRLPPDYQELQVQLSLAYWDEIANAQIEYRLPGRQDLWEPLPVGERRIRFRQLPHGRYTVVIRKVGALENGDPDVVRLHFVVLPHVYQTPWFFLGCLGLALIGIQLIVRRNADRLRRRNLALEANVRERTRELEHANGELRRTLNVKEMLVSIISHDIVTPLRFIARVASHAARVDDKAAPDEVVASVRDIAVSSAKLHANAENVLNWIKHQDHRIALQPRNVAVHTLAEEVLGMVKEQAAGQGIRLFNEVSPDDVVRTDRNVLSIILQNLVNNAVNHTRDSTIRIGASDRVSEYAITVSDTGTGMSPKALAHVRALIEGGPVEQAEATQGEGPIHGLGYVIITELMHLLGGRLHVDSGTGKGTRIALVFQRVPPLEDA